MAISEPTHPLGRPRHKIRNNVQPVRIPDPVKKRMDKLKRRRAGTQYASRSDIINRAVLWLLDQEGV